MNKGVKTGGHNIIVHLNILILLPLKVKHNYTSDSFKFYQMSALIRYMSVNIYAAWLEMSE